MFRTEKSRFKLTFFYRYNYQKLETFNISSCQKMCISVFLPVNNRITDKLYANTYKLCDPWKKKTWNNIAKGVVRAWLLIITIKKLS